jgi:hypothetical protein
MVWYGVSGMVWAVWYVVWYRAILWAEPSHPALRPLLMNDSEFYKVGGIYVRGELTSVPYFPF